MNIHVPESQQTLRVCETCGSENVWKDATACWSPEIQEYELRQIFDEEWCDDCDSKTNIIEKAP